MLLYIHSAILSVTATGLLVMSGRSWYTNQQIGWSATYYLDTSWMESSDYDNWPFIRITRFAIIIKSTGSFTEGCRHSVQFKQTNSFEGLRYTSRCLTNAKYSHTPFLTIMQWTGVSISCQGFLLLRSGCWTDFANYTLYGNKPIIYEGSLVVIIHARHELSVANLPKPGGPLHSYVQSYAQHLDEVINRRHLINFIR